MNPTLESNMLYGYQKRIQESLSVFAGQLLAETLLPHSLSHGCFIKQKHKKNYQYTSLSRLSEYDILSTTSVILQAQNAPKSLAAGAPPQTPLRELTTFHQIIDGWGRGKPTPQTPASSAPTRRLDSRAFGASILASDKCPSKQNRSYATDGW